MFIVPWESGMSATSLGLNCVLIRHAPCCANPPSSNSLELRMYLSGDEVAFGSSIV